MIDIQEVGTGGGSDRPHRSASALRVGPESAGSAPGPVCYGLGGTEPTVTDCNLVLGRLAPDRFLGGEMKLDLATRASSHRRKNRQAARPRYARGGRRHPARRRHQDGAYGALGDHRARPGCRRFRDGRLWRGRAAACRADRARIAHRQSHHPVCARAFLGLRHAVRRSAPRPGQHLVQATSPMRPSRRWKRYTPTWRSAARTTWRAAAT